MIRVLLTTILVTMSGISSANDCKEQRKAFAEKRKACKALEKKEDRKACRAELATLKEALMARKVDNDKATGDQKEPKPE